MAIRRSTDLKNHLLSTGSYDAALSGGFIGIFSDPTGAGVPNPDDAVPAATYPLVAKIAADAVAADAGVVGLTFDVAANGVLPKAAAQTWKAKVHVVGDGGPSTTQTPTFARFIDTWADIRAADSLNLQFTVSGPTGSGDALLEQDTYVDNGTNEIGITAFQIRMTE